MTAKKVADRKTLDQAREEVLGADLSSDTNTIPVTIEKIPPPKVETSVERGVVTVVSHVPNSLSYLPDVNADLESDMHGALHALYQFVTADGPVQRDAARAYLDQTLTDMGVPLDRIGIKTVVRVTDTAPIVAEKTSDVDADTEAKK